MKIIKIISIGCFVLLNIQFSLAQTNIFPSSGSIGIGTLDPLAKLDIRGGYIFIKNLANVTGESHPMIKQSLSFGTYEGFGTSINTYTESAGYNAYALQFFTQETYQTGLLEKFRISANGNVGIGTTSPQEKLSVNGKIRAKEVKVEVENWPDYVFDDDFKLEKLGNLERYIKENKKLPDMPSAREVEAQGIELGEINKKLLQKIEELTLYIIELKKENTQQQSDINLIKMKLK